MAFDPGKGDNSHNDPGQVNTRGNIDQEGEPSVAPGFNNNHSNANENNNNNNNNRNLNIDYQEYLEFLKFKQAKLQMGDANRNKSNNNNNNNNKGNNKVLIMTKEERTKYNQFVKTKQACLSQLNSNTAQRTARTTNNCNPNSMLRRSNNYQESNGSLRDLAGKISNIGRKSHDVYSMLMTDFEITEVECNKQWSNNTDLDNDNGAIDTITLMQKKIDCFDKFDGIIKQFYNNLDNNIEYLRNGIGAIENILGNVLNVEDLDKINSNVVNNVLPLYQNLNNNQVTSKKTKKLAQGYLLFTCTNGVCLFLFFYFFFINICIVESRIAAGRRNQMH